MQPSTTVGTPLAQRRRARGLLTPDRRRRFTTIPPLDPIRRPFSTRELEGVQERGDKDLQLAGLAELGQATAHGGRSLLCDLSSPIAVGSKPRYELGPQGAERSSTACEYSYRWSVRGRIDGRSIWHMVTQAPEIRIAAAAPGRYLVEVTVLADGTPTGVRLWLDQDVEVEPRSLTTGLQGADPMVEQTMRELVTELRPYILAAAAATGPHGIPARYLAAVLFIEILSRSKASRERDLEKIAAQLAELDRGDRILFPHPALDHPLGVAQIRPMTAAMVTGAAPWIDQDRADRQPVRDQLKINFDALPAETKRTLFTQLRWPKSNITMAARLLSTLKNRPNRYPMLTRAQLATNQKAVEIVATEYTSGGTRTPAADAQPSGYGRWVWHQMQESLMRQFFPDD